MNKKELVSGYQIQIKPLEPGDVSQIDHILVQHVRDRNTGEVLQKEIAQIEGFMRGERDEYQRIRKYLVAKTLDGQILGCMAYTNMDPDMVRHFPDLDSATSIELVNAFVDSQIFRGGGVGRKLFESVCNEARSEGKTHLVLNSGLRYKASWGFYDKMCTENRGIIFNKFGPGGDANTWVKIL